MQTGNRRKPISHARLRLLRLVARHQQRGTFPLVRELAEQLGLAGESSLTRTLRALQAEGYLTCIGGGVPRLQRIYRLTPRAEALVPDLLARPALPLFGAIPAGPIAEAIADAEAVVGCETLLDETLRVQPGDFLLRVKGDSMTGDGILPGDLALLRPGIQVQHGEIAAVHIRRSDGAYDSTLKHVRFTARRKSIKLRASNPAYPDITLLATVVEIAGVYRGLLRCVD